MRGELAGEVHAVGLDELDEPVELRGRDEGVDLRAMLAERADEGGRQGKFEELLEGMKCFLSCYRGCIVNEQAAEAQL